MKKRTYLLIDYLNELFATGVLPTEASGVDIVLEVLKDVQAMKKAADKTK